ncbi:formate dehydrogenase-N subunit alpha [Kingella negevensis]|uniref:formate dehydrogenase-N subunit alpha n=1 Tax=Kingella negevensis TaxID=1522312 RepID=UPI0009DF13E0|nr:formate dehydrogenase-N subunit alpha [Kingella negevensis]MDK4688617.1 formate dehydrogenase-N subunit alpha [Kingella negevensis]WII91638.1 formate dehydrogenase-N subunit alpha [Kingella negevensis]
MNVTRRQFFKVTAAGAGATTLAAVGMMPTAAFAEVRQYKLSRASEARNNCTYCSVGCGTLLYSMGDGAKNAKRKIFHIEGDPDHPVSRGSLCPKGASSIDFVNSPNRVQYPEVREPNSNEWKRISWDEALDRIARHIKDERDASFQEKNAAGVTVNRTETLGMLAASASSNETGILTVKFARALGIVALDTQARVCHGPTVAGLAPSFGRGAMTNSFVDIQNADFIMVMGGNAAEAHPVGFKWVIESKKRKGTKLFVVDPRFNRTAAVADFYAPIRAGSDIAFLGALINWLIENDKIQWDYVKNYTNASFIVHKDFDFNEGLFSGAVGQPESNKHAGFYDQSSWFYELDEKGFAKTDPTLKDPRCVFQMMKKHYSRYTLDMMTTICGTSKEDFLKVAEAWGETSAPDKAGTVLYALGWTQHTYGAQIIRTMAMVQLLLGNMGMAGGGINALRGHSNIQGLTDLGLMTTALPGYIPLPNDKAHPTLQDYLDKLTPKALQPNQLNYWKNTPAFMVSLLKWFYGDYATKENQFAYDMLPKYEKMYDVMQITEDMYQGKMKGLLVQGFNAQGSFPDAHRVTEAFSKLKFMVVMDPLKTETASFWEKHGEAHDIDPSKIATEVFRLPTPCFAEEEGSIVNSSRWLQWHHPGADPQGESLPDLDILGELYQRIKALYEKEGGKCPEPITKLAWNYKDPKAPKPAEMAKESNGYALADLTDEEGNIVRRKGELLSGFSQLRDDGTTSCACWVFSGSWTEAGNQMDRRDNTDTGLGNTPKWAFAWPANRRILYNRASCDPSGKPWDKNRVLVEWNGKKWVGADVADFKADEAPNSGMNPFIMNEEGVARLFCQRKMVDGPFPEHYEPLESPIGTNPLHPKVVRTPALRLFDSVKDRVGTHEEFPYVATTYRLTEHFQFWTKSVKLLMIGQPEQFCEISEELAKEKGIQKGDWVKISSKRAWVKVRAVVTKRVKPLTINGKTVHQIGIPLHGGWENVSGQQQFLVNSLTPFVGDCNTQTPEYKAFLVNIEKA